MENIKSCCDCKFFDGVCCMYEYNFLAILDEEESAEKCNHYEFGIYNEKELEIRNYK